MSRLEALITSLCCLFPRKCLCDHGYEEIGMKNLFTVERSHLLLLHFFLLFVRPATPLIDHGTLAPPIDLAMILRILSRILFDYFA